MSKGNWMLRALGVGACLVVWLVGIGVEAKSFSLELGDGPTPAHVIIHSDAGPIKLTGSSLDTVVSHGVIKLGKSDSNSRRALEVLQPTLNRSAGDPSTVEIRFRIPSEFKQNRAYATMQVDFPRSARVSVTTANGQVSVVNAGGGVELKTSNAGIFATMISGGGTLQTSNGRIDVRTLSGGAHLKTTNAQIVAREIEGDLDAKTTNARVWVDGVSGHVDVGTTNGPIDFEAAQPPLKPVKLSSTNGVIRAKLPRDSQVQLDLDTTNGGIHIESSVALQTTRRGKDHFLGQMGASGPRFTARTTNGGVYVDFYNVVPQ